MAQKPNIVLFFTDDQRFDTIAALGNPAIRTPNMDRLVARGTAFTRAHIPCGTSGAVCMPSRAMLHTGRTLFHLDGAGERVPAEHTLLGEALGAAGYRTFGVGKWHNGREAYQRSFQDGDEIFFGGMTDHWNVPAYHYDPTGRYDSVLNEVKQPLQSNAVTERPCDHIQPGRHSSEIFCDAAINYLERYDGGAPFFLYLAFLAPHDPRTMPQAYRDLYDADAIELPPNFMGGHPFENGDLHGRDEKLAPFPRTPDDTRRQIAEYYAMISHLDAQLGRVLDALERQGLTENTIIVFAGDNGLALGRHGLFGKQNCYEHSVRIPLILAGPGIPQGERREGYVYLLDIFPTLCELIGIEAPASVEGRSFAAALRDPAVITRETLYF
ncbi:MAG TPA: sulfatase-like hydrolase/transferase, partial [Limnochordia bacterium]|nr:sulfatase-like hydrolase/transferase [Limnochordia bacterium]